jgi:hypothetical protein
VGRGPPASGGGAEGAELPGDKLRPQYVQNFDSAGLLCPHDGQATSEVPGVIRLRPHRAQNVASGRLTAPQAGQDLDKLPSADTTEFPLGPGAGPMDDRRHAVRL